MGSGGAAALALAGVTVVGVVLAFAVLAWLRGRGPELAWSRRMGLVHGGMVVLGIILPKSVLRATSFVTVGPWLMVVAAAVGLVVALRAAMKRQPGAIPWTVLHLFVAGLCASPAGPSLFGIFLMM